MIYALAASRAQLDVNLPRVPRDKVVWLATMYDVKMRMAGIHGQVVLCFPGWTERFGRDAAEVLHTIAAHRCEWIDVEEKK